nr:proline-serine-threonine phosphatase-interacting protein 2 isoform X1 [Ciona intestinalis]|eukprot:XP_002128806.1 proline-serine-threonine phosphatase-interacting protein 2 isoform X1 [Ciona intestinalis]
MSYPPGTFRGSFWERDFVTQTGFETVVTHVKEGQRACKWLEDYLKLRSKAEDEFAKALLKASKLELPTMEYSGTLKSSLDTYRTEAEEEANFHSNLAQRFSEEASKLNEFHGKQKEERKKHEDIVHRTHKNKAELYRKMMQCKSSYESKCKSSEKADSDAEKLKFGNKPKEAEKAKKNAAQCRSSALKADEDYKSSIGCVESARQLWITEHSTACDVFQRMEEDRIKCMRNTVWVCCNFVSDVCCKLDNSRERIRQITENCDPSSDIKEFIAQKSTCIAPLQQIEYGSAQNNANSDPGFGSKVNGHIYESEDDYSPTSSNAGSVTSQTVCRAIYDYNPNSEDELALQKGDQISLRSSTTADDGWMNGYNHRTKCEGLFPQNYVNF